MTSDEKQILVLLLGQSKSSKGGLPVRNFLKGGSAEELDARRALARTLRSSRPLDPGLRSILADLIDPDRDEINRHIRFMNRRKGKPSSDAAFEKKVAEFIWSRKKELGKTEAAIASAEAEFALGRSQLMAIWSEWKSILKRLKRQ